MNLKEKIKMTTFQNNLVKLRKQSNLSLQELADRLNKNYEIRFTKSSIDRWERGESTPSVTQASTLAHFFNVSLDELSGLEDLKSQKPQTIAAHLNGELHNEEDVQYILGLIERLKREDKGE